MTLQPFAQPPLSLALGAGRDLPGQAARVRAEWLAPRPGRAPAFLLALLWGRGCANVVQAIEGHLDALFADYACTPEGWPEAQAARQVLASLNMQLYRRRREGEPGVLELAAGLLLVHAGGVHFSSAAPSACCVIARAACSAWEGAASRWVAARSWRWSSTT